MKSYHVFTLLAVFAFLAASSIYFWKTNSTHYVPIPAAGNPDIEITVPAPSQRVQNPIIIQGKARGTWFFEGSFPIKVVDANGKVLCTTTSKTTDNWMTTDFIN